MSTLSYQFGYLLGFLVVKARKALRDSRSEQSGLPSHRRPSMEELAHTPAMVRKGINLNDWYNQNVVCPPRWKLRRKRNKHAGKRGSADSVI